MKKYYCNSWVLLVAAALAAPVPAFAQKKGANVRIDYGIVDAAKPTQVQSEAGKGVLLGGALGAASASGKSTSKKIRNAIIGGAVLGTAAAAKEDLSAMAYSVKMLGGSTVQIVSDQKEIRRGDCVAIEQSGDLANIRRVSSTMCDPKSQSVVAEVQKESVSEADECLAVKKELMNAETDEAVDRAMRKVKILCDM